MFTVKFAGSSKKSDFPANAGKVAPLRTIYQLCKKCQQKMQPFPGLRDLSHNSLLYLSEFQSITFSFTVHWQEVLILKIK